MAHVAEVLMPDAFCPVEPAQGAAIELGPIASIRTRADAEALVVRDHAHTELDPEWMAYFVEAMVSFVVWQNQPWGAVSESELDWLMGLLADAPSPTTPALLFALVRELNDAPERLTALAMRHSKNRLCGVTTERRGAL